MTRGKRTHVYTGKYALVGADASAISRLSVRAHVQLPYGDLDRWSKPIGPEQTLQRNRRVQTRAIEEAQRNNQNHPQLTAQAANRKTGSISGKVAWSVILIAVLFVGLLLLQQLNALAQKEQVLSTLKMQIETQSETNRSLEQTLLEAADEVKVRYAAVQQLGMVAPKGAQSIELVAPETQILPKDGVTGSIPQASGFFATLFAFLD